MKFAKTVSLLLTWAASVAMTVAVEDSLETCLQNCAPLAILDCGGPDKPACDKTKLTELGELLRKGAAEIDAALSQEPPADGASRGLFGDSTWQNIADWFSHNG